VCQSPDPLVILCPHKSARSDQEEFLCPFRKAGGDPPTLALDGAPGAEARAGRKAAVPRGPVGRMANRS